ncbi:hypothetical protein NLG97_g618 [Lecanicillium saksenae]|uniref:Uncharacterized protein n=1 Tax=Lecanicillium saksenae TaxID=468837 RepID=A0ACC1R9H2_9HYPO|nr:hypothetical protein NLG97_g618 [Lecanicillium saksenae]
MLSTNSGADVPRMAPVPIFLAAADRTQLFAQANALVAEFHNSGSTLSEIVTQIHERQDTSLRCRAATMISDIDDLSRLADNGIADRSTKPPIVLVFGGQILESHIIARQLYCADDRLKLNLDACVGVCKDLGLGDITPYLFGEISTANVVLSHCAALAIQIAAAQTWCDYGLQPEVLVGHSTGELAALNIAGVLTLHDTFHLLSARIKCIDEDSCDRGPIEMAQLLCHADEIESLVHSFNASGSVGVEIVCYNSDRNYIIAGNQRSISEFARHCTSFDARVLREKLFFHSSAQGTASLRYRRILDEIHIGSPTVPVEECTEVGENSSLDSNRLSESANGPVYFSHAIKRISERLPSAVWLEGGSSSGALSVVRDILGNRSDQNLFLQVNLEKPDSLDSIFGASFDMWKSGNNAACWSFPPVALSQKEMPQSKTSTASNDVSERHIDSLNNSSSNAPQCDRATIMPQLRQILSDIMGMPTSAIKEASTLSDLGLKSVLANTVMSEVQEYFQINIETELQEQCITIADVAECIEKALSRAAMPNHQPDGRRRDKTTNKDISSTIEQETVVFKSVDGLDLEADIFYPSQPADPSRPLPVALMIHGGGHVMLSRHDTRPHQTARLLQDGFLPITVDYRLCPEVPIKEGPMTDVVDALSWARNILPAMKLKRSDVRADGNQVVAIGWSTGGTLVMSLGFNCLARGVRPPEASLVFYCPIDYEDPFWMTPNVPIGSEHANSTFELDDLVAAGLSDKPITKYNVNTAKRAVGGWMSATDGRSRLVLYMNWHGRALHVLLHGLNKSDLKEPPTPTPEQIASICPLAQIRRGNYSTPTFIIHSQDDDLVPWKQAHRVWQGLQKRGIDSQLRLIDDAPHLFDLYTRYNKRPDIAQAVKEGYDFLKSHVELD